MPGDTRLRTIDMTREDAQLLIRAARERRRILPRD
jgi:hypothetical protein